MDNFSEGRHRFEYLITYLGIVLYLALATFAVGDPNTLAA